VSKKNTNIQFLDNIAIADTAFTVKAKTLPKLFSNAAYALMLTMADIDKIQPRTARTINIRNAKIDLLLFDFLNELLIYKDNESLLFSKFQIDIQNKNNIYYLNACIKGEQADQVKHKIKIDVKAITMHMFKVEKTQEGYEARIVVDI
jgi:SHS2 domain-containing protein